MSPDDPPVPNNPPPAPRPAQPPDEVLEAYNTVAETVGGVPSLRWKDNLIQGAAIAGSLLLGILIGFLVSFNIFGAAVGGFCGLLAGLLVSGIVLMVLGWVRAYRNVRRWGSAGKGGRKE
jgi:hypothetical protein